MKKVLFLITGLEKGGLETYLLRFLEHNIGKFKPFVLCRKRDYDLKLYEKYKLSRTNIIIFPLSVFSPITMFKFYSILKQEKFTSVCDFSGDFAGYTLFISKVAGVKNRFTFYRESVYQFKMTKFKRVFLWAIKRMLKYSTTKYLSNSEEAFNNFHPNWRKNSDKYKVIYNGIVENSISFKRIRCLKKNILLPENAFVIGHVGRFTPAKNYDAIINIAKYFKNENDNVYFVLFGRGVADGIKNKIKAFDLQNIVITPGQIENVYEAHQLMNIFLFPSLNEGQPNALLEAMFSCIPVIASNIPAHKESLPNYFWPQLIPPDDTNGFIVAIENILNGITPYSVYELQNWVKNTYHPDKRFNEFYREIIG